MSVSLRTRAISYLELMKLRVVELLLVTTLPAMVLAEGGLPSLSLTVATLIGGTLAAGSANAFNMVIESESDKLMKRTAKRPLATGLLTKSEAIIFATAIGVISLIIFQKFQQFQFLLTSCESYHHYILSYHPLTLQLQNDHR